MKIKTKAVAYLRVSSADQVSRDGFDRQRLSIQQYAAANDIEIVEEFRDEGVSGTREALDRPALSRLIDRIAGDGVRIVLVEKSDRIGRDLIVSELVIQRFSEMGVRVFETDGGNDLSENENSTAILIRQILGAVSQFEKSALVGKLRSARERIRARDGVCEGRKPFGEKPGEQEVLDRLDQLARKPRNGSKRSMAQIAQVLNDEGFLTRSGQPWSRQFVHKLLTR